MSGDSFRARADVQFLVDVPYMSMNRGIHSCAELFQQTKSAKNRKKGAHESRLPNFAGRNKTKALNRQQRLLAFNQSWMRIVKAAVDGVRREVAEIFFV